MIYIKKRHPWRNAKKNIKVIFITFLASASLFASLGFINYFLNRDFCKFVKEIKTIDKIIEKNYYGKILEKKELYFDTCKAYVNAIGCKYNTLLNEKELENIAFIKNRYFGVGATIRLLELIGRPGEYVAQIVAMEKDSPLERAGFLPGDIIEIVNNSVVRGYCTPEDLDKFSPVVTDSQHIWQLLAGLGDTNFIFEGKENIVNCNSGIDSEPYTAYSLSTLQKVEALSKDVYIKVGRKDPKSGKYIEYENTVRKGRINFKTATWNVIKDKNIGYLRLKNFNINASKDFADGISELLKSKVKGIVIDLRGNLGGIIDEFNKIITQVIKNGPLYEFVGVNKRFNKRVSATGKNFKTNIPLVVLVNGNSASAAEMFAADIQSHKRGTVIGKSTYGKGVSQIVYDVGNGNYLLLVVQAWRALPGNLDIDVVGVKPDIEVEGPDLEWDTFAVYGEDAQLTKAVDLLSQEKQK